MKRAILMLALLLAACGGESHSDLKQELNSLSKDLRGKIPPLPVVKPYEPVAYGGGEMPDPFSAAKMQLEIATASTGGGLKPDLNRPKEPLEAVPLESLKMVGMLQQGKQTFALVKADNSLYRVKPGNYLGQNFGLITNISENQIQLRELVQDAVGDWIERESALQLQEAGGRR